MDSITHIALGAVIGEVMAGKKIGKHALVMGAIAQSLPDIDFVASAWLSFSENLLAHRGFSHSFVFVLLAAASIAFILEKWYSKAPLPWKQWFVFWLVQMSIHLLIDSCNAYGTGWFEPFSHARIAFHFLFVADPLYTFWLLMAAVMLIVLNRHHPWRMLLATSALAISTLYIAYAYINKFSVEEDIKNELANQGIRYERLLTTPTPLNSWLWFVAVDVDSGFYISHRAVAERNTPLNLRYFPRNHQALDTVDDQQTLQHLLQFSQGYYLIEQREGKLIFSDLRFGQITGWATPDALFVFHFYLCHPEDNLLVVQRGRFANWNRETIRVMIRRIRGMPVGSI
jgi:inner membrane protein